ncbi:MAG TPA: DUF1109 domain-containing protein [Rhizomicrobium sp.]|jgi:hypothetical protein
MNTADLIAQLSGELKPTPRHAPILRLVPIVLAGAAVSAVLMVAWLGIRPDLMSAMHTLGYWVKFGYTAALAGAALWLVLRLSCPGSAVGAPTLAALVPLPLILIIAMQQLMNAPPALHKHLMMGSSSQVCPWRIVILALPILAATLIAVRRLAPTRLMLAGAGAGVFAGALGAWIYAFHCDESAAPFVAIWYTFGIAVVGAAGGALGRASLRW